ncbi:hypothetical protein KJ765_01930 [Candidatus Micrarchaeota archaeon]|nr:hypothetical protein [Candidatus Micrarchaeota archaeon]
MRILHFIVLTLFLLPFAQAECKSFVGAHGFPLGIVPSQSDFHIVHPTLESLDVAFTVYIEGDALGGDLGGCSVSISVDETTSENHLVEFFPSRIETGLGWGEPVISMRSTPREPWSNTETVFTLMDVDNSDNFVEIPLKIENQFDPPAPSLNATPTPTPLPEPTAELATPTPLPPDLASQVTDIGKELENDSTRYIVAVLAFFFLAALLWVGIRTLQRD